MKILFSLFLICISLRTHAQKELISEDAIYEEGIQTVLLYPTHGVSQDPSEMIQPPIVQLNTKVLKLEFDELGDQYNNYFLKIVNCNWDWSISQLNAIQYLNEYNEYQITERQNSFNTRVPYIHYKITLPRTKISGNYLAVVYRNSDDKDIVLSRRFVVYENLADIALEAKFPLNVEQRYTGQQIDFIISVDKMNVNNPLKDIKCYLRQNFRWDNAKVNLQPSFYNEMSKTLQFKFFNGETVFNGLNEYRYFDIRSNRFNGQNVGKATFDPDKTEILLMDHFNRSEKPYSFYSDFMNGKFYIQNYESGDSETQPDYVYVTFLLNSPKIDKKVYVFGGLAQWTLSAPFEMTYNTAINKYAARVLLKQGQYNYSFAIESGNNVKADESYFEGSFNNTQNVYDLLVYYRPLGSVSDHVIGYKSVNYQGR